MKKISTQGKYFRLTSLFILLAELLSFFCYSLNNFIDLYSIAFALIVLLVFAVSLKNPEYGLFAALTELFIGSKGQLFSANIFGATVSIRIGIFCAVLIAWIIFAIRKGLLKQVKQIFIENKILIVLSAVSIFAVAMALFRGNSPTNIFFDFNAWLYFLYIFPLLTIFKKPEQLKTLFQIFTASVASVAIKSLIFLYIFSHNFPIIIDFYKWGRDTRWGEFTLVSGNFFRIFSQAQIFALLGCCILIGYIIFKEKFNFKKDWSYLIVILLSASTIILSLSRSFWLSLAGAAALLTFFFWKYKFSFKRIAINFSGIICLVVLAILLVLGIVNFPLPKVMSADSSSLLKSRLNMDESAVSSRQSQLLPLLQGIKTHPVVGSGWGTTVTYESSDPRIKTIDNPLGKYTTYSFELGYLDMILKIGIFGVLVYLIFIWSIARKIFLVWNKKTDRSNRALLAGLSLGLAALVIVHIFSPYLNHPLGIGYLLLILVFVQLISTANSISLE